MIPYGRQEITEEDISEVEKILRSDFLTQGPTVPKFEKRVASYCGASYSIAVNSATSALHIACLALNLGDGDWLWTSPNTFVASANCGKYCGANIDFVDIDPNTLVSDLTVAKMQLCEIAKALSLKAKILLLDEPTSSLSPQESKILFSLLKKIVREEGVSIVFVSHKLEEVFNICDDVTVLRDGQNACTSEDIKNLDRQKLVRLMIGRDEQIVKSTRKNQNTKDTILALKNVKTELGHKNINLELNRSEIIGLYGLVGAGRTELMKCLIGQDKITDGEVIINGKKVTINSPKSALEKFKIGYISEDRKKEGLILIHNVLDNTSITVWSQIKKAIGFVSDGMISKKVDPYISQLEVKTPSNYQLISNLSGGNQQKISVAKWLAAGTDILIIDEPTVGIDIKTKAYLHELIIKLADDGTSIILISSDMPEMISLADKIIVMNNFQMNGIVENNHDYDSVSSKIMEYIHT